MISLTSLSLPVIVLAGFGNLPGDMVYFYTKQIFLALPFTLKIWNLLNWGNNNNTLIIFLTCNFGREENARAKTNMPVCKLSRYTSLGIWLFCAQAFWDYSEKNLVAKTKAECSVTSEWSPDGRHFMTATTAPRLQIDNGIKIFDHNGSLQFKKMFEKLYQADWKPEAPERFGDITDLTTSLSSLKIEETKKQAQGSKSAQSSSKAPLTASTASKPTAYRPPQAKGLAEVQQKVYLYMYLWVNVIIFYTTCRTISYLHH